MYLQMQLVIIRPQDTTPVSYLVVSSTDATPTSVGINSVDVTPPVDIMPSDMFAMYSPTTNPIPYSVSLARTLCTTGKFFTVSNPSPLPKDSVLPASQLTTIPCRVYSVQIDTDPGGIGSLHDKGCRIRID